MHRPRICSKCNHNIANLNRSWCQICYDNSRNNNRSHGGSPICAVPGCTNVAYPGSPACSHGHYALLKQGASSAKICAVHSCSRPVHPGSDACSQRHYALLKQGASSAKICAVHSCSRPVHPGSPACSHGHYALLKQGASSSARTCIMGNSNCNGTICNSSAVCFYDSRYLTYYLTNFWLCVITVVFPGGIKIIFNNLEQIFQVAKFLHLPDEQFYMHVKRILQLPPRGAFNYPRDPNNSGDVNQAWHTIKEEVMYFALLMKFSQNLDLLQKLLATGQAVLIEHTTKDSEWGDGGNGSGKNMLGKLLMRVRDELGRELRATGRVIPRTDFSWLVRYVRMRS